jgi:hypothetical protein
MPQESITWSAQNRPGLVCRAFGDLESADFCHDCREDRSFDQPPAMPGSTIVAKTIAKTRSA